MATHAEATALTRSREAEYATDDAGDEQTPDAHRHAAELHHEAARWQRKAGRRSRAEMHDEQARIHEQLAVRIAGEHDPHDPDQS